MAMSSSSKPLFARFVFNVFAHVPAQYENTPVSVDGSVEKNLSLALDVELFTDSLSITPSFKAVWTL